MRLEAALLACFLGCSAAPLPADLKIAEDHERAGRDEEALAAYKRAGKSCREIDDEQRRLEMCSAAYLQRAELLVAMNRKREGADGYLLAARVLDGDRPAVARATLRAGALLLSLGEAEAGYRYLWQVIADFPDEAFAGDALKELLRDGRSRSPRALDHELARLSSALAGTEIVDNLLYARAQLAENELDDKRAALDLYDQIAAQSTEGGFYDDALFLGAEVARELKDAEGAVRRLRALQETREVSWGVGSYFSVHLDNGKLLLGQVLRTDLRRPREALAVFEELPELYPDSVLHDDALFEAALALSALGESDRACKKLDRLRREHPDSKYELGRSDGLRSRLRCSAKGSASGG